MTRVRFAPSPTGHIHIGNLRTALLNWLHARSTKGSFLLRFDDTDRERSRQEYIDGIKEDLAWLGLDYDETAFQSKRIEKYNQARDLLIASGRLYPCYETSEELEKKRKIQRAQSIPPVYDRAALKLSLSDRERLEADGMKPHWRFLLDQKPIKFHDAIRGDVTIDAGSLSDPVLIRADGSYLYTLCSVVDDLDFNITHVIRGDDHESNSAVQIQIFEALGGHAPAFAHHSMLVDEHGGPLSKRLGSLSLRGLREEGYEPGALLCYLAQLGHGEQIEPTAHALNLTKGFRLDRLSKAPARLLVNELDQINARILAGLEFEEVAHRLAPLENMSELWPVVRGNITKLQDVEKWHDLLFGPRVVEKPEADLLVAALDKLPSMPFTQETWSSWTAAISQATGLKGKKLFMPLRLALTGADKGPEMAQVMPLLGRELVASRLGG